MLRWFASARKLIRIRSPNFNDKHARAALVQALKQRPSLKAQLVLVRGYNESLEHLDGGTNAEVVAKLYEELRLAQIADRCERRLLLRDGRLEPLA